jgi:hypothetical protein
VFADYVKQYGNTDTLFPYTPRFIEMLLTDIAKKAGVQKKVTAGILRDTFVVRRLKWGERIEDVLRKIGLNESTWEDAREKCLRLAGRAIKAIVFILRLRHQQVLMMILKTCASRSKKLFLLI